MKVNDVAKLTGVTVRTLHYYDQIGLLKPEKVTDTGYRSYTSKDLELLQQILFFRELDFPLTQIKEIMEHPNYDRREALKRQRELLHKKQLRLKKMVHLIDRLMDGDQEISFHEFDMTEIENMKQQYVYEECPVLAGSRFQLRFIESKDAKDLYQVYGDKKALLFFNRDNCRGCSI